MFFSSGRTTKAVEVLLWAGDGSAKSRRDFIRASTKVVTGNM